MLLSRGRQAPSRLCCCRAPDGVQMESCCETAQRQQPNSQCKQHNANLPSTCSSQHTVRAVPQACATTSVGPLLHRVQTHIHAK